MALSYHHLREIHHAGISSFLPVLHYYPYLHSNGDNDRLILLFLVLQERIEKVSSSTQPTCLIYCVHIQSRSHVRISQPSNKLRDFRYHKRRLMNSSFVEKHRRPVPLKFQFRWPSLGYKNPQKKSLRGLQQETSLHRLVTDASRN